MAMGFYVDVTRCTGCRACEVACKDKNRLHDGMRFRNAHTFSTGRFPRVTAFSCTFSCNHCEMPMCMANCPQGAIEKDALTGVVRFDEEKCVGCGACVSSCPYGVPVMDEDRGVARKCDSCEVIRANGGEPACVAACPSRALAFGEIEDIVATWGPDLAQATAVHPDPSQTMPNVRIKTKPGALTGDYVEVAW